MTADGPALPSSAEMLRVLLIEDNAADARLVRALLDDVPHLRFMLEHQTRLANGLQRLRETRFDALLLDLSLPDSHGVATVAQVLRSQPGLPVVVLTGLATRRSPSRRCRAGPRTIC